MDDETLGSWFVAIHTAFLGASKILERCCGYCFGASFWKSSDIPVFGYVSRNMVLVDLAPRFMIPEDLTCDFTYGIVEGDDFTVRSERRLSELEVKTMKSAGVGYFVVKYRNNRRGGEGCDETRMIWRKNPAEVERPRPLPRN